MVNGSDIMSEELLKNIESMLGEKLDPTLELLMNTLSEQAPIIGKILTSFKIHRLGVRLKNAEKQISELQEQVSKIDDQQFADIIKNFLFPAVLQELLEEDEDNKIGYFLEGFGQTINERIMDKDKILIFFDILRKLRFIEIEYLISLSAESKWYNSSIYYETGKFVESPFENEDFIEMKHAVESKLESLGLIWTGRSMSYNQIIKRYNYESQLAERHLASPSVSDSITITSFGYKFLNLFNLLDRFQKNKNK